MLPCRAGSSAGDSARTARLAGAQVRHLPEGRGRPQGPSRPPFPDSLGSRAPLALAGADPATASSPPPPPAARPVNAAVATTLGTGAPGRRARTAGQGIFLVGGAVKLPGPREASGGD